MANTTGLPVLFATGIHSARPAASAVGAGGLYSCTTHSLVYQTDGSSWTTWAAVGGSSTRASLGLDTTDSPEFAGLNVGAATDTTITRTGAGEIAVEGNRIFRVGGADVPVADGGTGASTASGARTNLGLVLGTDVASLTSGRVPIAQLASGTPDGTKFIRDDGTLQTPAGGGGGGLAQSFIGYNTVGASQESLTVNRQLMKTFTLSGAALITSIDVHIQATGTDPTSFIAMILDDSAGSPTLVRAEGYIFQLGLKGGNAARWLSIPVSVYLASGTYWMGITPTLIGASGMKLDYDTSGSDRYFTVGGFALDGDYTTTADSTRKYSMRASILS